MCLGRLQINWTGSSCFSVQVWRWMVMKNYKWVVNFSCSKLLKEWWWRPTSEFVNFSCSELLIYPYLAWNDVFIPIYVLNELLQANIRIRTITRICGDRWSIFAQVILTLLILSCAAQYVLCSHCCYNCHQTSWMDLASFGPYAMHFWKNMFIWQSPGRNGCLLLGKLWASTLQVRPANFEFSSIELALIKNINCLMTNRLSLPG